VAHLLLKAAFGRLLQSVSNATDSTHAITYNNSVMFSPQCAELPTCQPKPCRRPLRNHPAGRLCCPPGLGESPENLDQRKAAPEAQTAGQ